MKHALASLLVSTSLLHAVALAQDAAPERLGTIDCPNSGASCAQQAFLHGVLLLHSFEYEDAAEAFRQAQSLDPAFALAYWGESLTYCHPIWNEDNRDKARAALERLAPTPAERLLKAPTEREQGLLAAVELLWGEGQRLERNRAYAAAMEALHARFPDDDEIAAFTAVAILGTSGPTRDVPTYMRAAAIAEEVYEKNHDHPGAIHYAIHAYDDPVHAPLGLRMANRYAACAPAAQHALHMPSHIYVALGMWQESAATNVRSIAAADERRARKGLDVDARAFHSIAWLSYSDLQLGQVNAATRLLEGMQRDVAEKDSKRTQTHLGLLRAAYLVDALEAPGRAAALAIQLDSKELGLEVAAANLFVSGAAAAERGDLEGAGAALQTIAQRLADAETAATAAGTASSCCRGSSGSYGAGTPEHAGAEVMQKELEGVIALASAKPEDGLAALREAARLEDAMGFDFGPPGVVKPAHELLGEALLARGDAAGAASEFGTALKRAPKRARALLGQARALARSGDDGHARAVYAELAGIWRDADEGLQDLAEVRSGAQ